MSNEITVNTQDSQDQSPLEPADNANRLRWFEIFLVILVAFGGFIFSSIDILRNGRGALPEGQNSRWTFRIFQEVTSLLLLRYVLLRRRTRFAELGLKWSLGELTAGFLVTVVSYAAYAAGYAIVHSLHHAVFPAAASGPTPRQIFGHPSIAAIPLFLLNPFCEELIVRAYLMNEVKALTGSWILSTALSVAVQASYHLYYGWEGALTLSFQFLAFSIYYARTRRITPIIIAHGVFDIYGLVSLW